ncbi:cell filamentation protein Fic [Rathayibacter tritici]|uniref:Fic family protein n=1 Tax=Rathayibacter tritici TaxID=33888 RepID=UPI000CE7F423|nr:Fic family protein [Rathayibacter tritici]PPF28834.1 cell filamentation protein Fic [Rathayibacter tritici]PPF67916.1 cell filamentation protein Fic [Rathayibacter tritici]PPG09492.1 cell filamentation protein Fic [Rathayibacter tritici]PPI13363.1 cell filamentation protein Fic [Rathayibacter tritici]
MDLVVADLAAVVYTSGRVFDGLATGRFDTESFLRSGDLSGVTSRADLALLEDLRDASRFIIENRTRPIDADYVREINGTLTRSGSLHPGRLRSTTDRIGVSTRFGRHEPEAVDEAGLQRILVAACAAFGPREQALDLFVKIAKAQPFMDGNKRTAIFTANSLLLRQDPPELLTVPVDERAPDSARRFNDLLARAYLHDEHDPVKDLLRRHGFQPVRPRSI